VSGDYKTGADATCAPFEPLRCHTFITESTFGLPVFKWRPQQDVLADINTWWRANRDQGRTSIMFAYALGKAQRILAGVDPSIGPIFTHGAVENVNACYRRQGVYLPATRHVGQIEDRGQFKGALVIAPPSADVAAWTRKFKNPGRAFASGWMHIRGHRRRRTVDRGFVLSDHCDWDGLNRVIGQTGAESVWVTHGYAGEMVRWLTELGYDARVLPTRYEDRNDQ
jgi:putative mRNA 3-end processing factor